MTAGLPGGTWQVVPRTGSAWELHARPTSPPGRLVEVMTWRRTALVLGSTQPFGDIDRVAVDRAGADVVQRRSGGGAVLIRPGHDLWIDVTIARDDPQWVDDVAVSFHWLGRAWADALGGLGVAAEVHVGHAIAGPWSRRVCFAGLGAGEVTVAGLGGRRRKVVGLSQRRTRQVARFQCLVPGSWDPAGLLALLRLDGDERAAGVADLADVATGPGRSPAELTAALVGSLPG